VGADDAGSDRLQLTGTIPASPGDPALATQMKGLGVALYEEALLEVLLRDLHAASDAGV
jgi:hypothetical protein